MPNFVWDNTSLPADKVNAVSVPTGANLINYISGTDVNAVFNALKELRAAVWKMGGRLTPASAPPATGTYAVGDVVLNSTPAVAAPIGWVCTVGGAPGTWKEFGVIADDVVNGGSSGGTAGPSDVATPGRSFAGGVGGSAVYEFWPDGVADVRRGVIGFLGSADPVLSIANEKPSGGIVRITPGAGAWIEAVNDLRTPKITPITGALLELVAAKLKLTGTNTATLDLYPDGPTTRRGFVGFDTASETVLHLKNEKSTNGHVRIEPGSGGSLQLGAGETTGFKALKVFTTTWNPPSTGHSSSAATSVTVAGVGTNDPIIGVSLSSISDAGVFLAGHVIATDTVGITLINESGATVDPGSGTLKIVWLDLA